MAGVTDVWAEVDRVDGWLSRQQAEALFERAASLRPGATVVEIGSHHGRSTIVLAKASPPDATIVAIDPHAGSDRGPREIKPNPTVGDTDHDAFHQNLAAAGVEARVRHLRMPSDRARAELDGSIDLLYIDGAHRFRAASSDIRHWAQRVGPGQTMLIHDSFNAVGVTLAQFRHLVFTRRFRYEGRTGSLATYTRQNLSGGARARNAWRQLSQLGYFGQSIAIKIALVAKRPSLARRLGHQGGPWPY